MSSFVIEEKEGGSYQLAKDGAIVFTGCASHCLDEAFRQGVDGKDTLTSGTVSEFVNRPIEEIRSKCIKDAKNCGYKVDQYGVVTNP